MHSYISGKQERSTMRRKDKAITDASGIHAINAQAGKDPLP
ncbi:hypothetical protein [Desulfosarcina alkanivorans]|jgi:hypothetical protein|nr:hypothetical protein [Desulfosarcina alkanivorans]